MESVKLKIYLLYDLDHKVLVVSLIGNYGSTFSSLKLDNDKTELLVIGNNVKRLLETAG